MTLSFKHLFQSAKTDAADTALVRPTNWNAEHDVELTGPALVGRTAASQGAAAEIALSGALGIASDTLKVFVPGYTNADIVESHAASAATFALKTIAGADASAADPITAYFGDGTTATLTAALSVTIPSTALMGTRNGIPFRLWFALINDGGAFRLGVRNCVTTAAASGSGSIVTAISGFPDHGTLSSTIMDTSSDSAGVTYTDTAVSTDPFVVLGYADYNSGQATAGTWASSPSGIVMYGAGIPLPGAPTGNYVLSQSGAVASASTTMPDDDTIPQIGEGTQYQSVAITPNSVENVLEIYAKASYACASAPRNIVKGLFQDAISNALTAIVAHTPNTDSSTLVELNYWMLAATTSSTTLRTRTGSNDGSAVTFNGNAGARQLGGVNNGIMRVTEYMG